MRSENARGHLDLVLLAILASGPSHGYAVINELRRLSDGVFDLPEGSVYPALHRLEDLRLVRSEWKPVGGRRRREYRLTPAGTRALASQRKEWVRLAAGIEAVLAAKAVRRGLRRPVSDLA
jgi:DNA-binding PadR family transcriptional regulator